MVTLLQTSGTLRKMFRKTVKGNMNPWSEQLYGYLNKYGVSEKKCRSIAASRAYFAFYREDKKLIDVFGDINGPEHAVRIYNAYIRHECTSYDLFCEEVNSCFSQESRFSPDEMKVLWRMQCPEEFDAYEKKCIFIDKYGKRLYNQHFVFTNNRIII